MSNWFDRNYWAIVSTLLGIMFGFSLFQYTEWHVAGEYGRAMADCRASSLVNNSLKACFYDSNCNMSDDEVFTMYRSGKESVISCKLADEIRVYQRAEELVKKLQEEKEAAEKAIEEAEKEAEEVEEVEEAEEEPTTPPVIPDSELQTSVK
jgi:hypothetical protein